MSDHYLQNLGPLGLREYAGSTLNVSTDDISTLNPTAPLSGTSSGFQSSSPDDGQFDTHGGIETGDVRVNRNPRRGPSSYVRRRRGAVLNDLSLESESEAPWQATDDEQCHRLTPNSVAPLSRTSSGFQTSSLDDSQFDTHSDIETSDVQRIHCRRRPPSSYFQTNNDQDGADELLPRNTALFQASHPGLRRRTSSSHSVTARPGIRGGRSARYCLLGFCWWLLTSVLLLISRTFAGLFTNLSSLFFRWRPTSVLLPVSRTFARLLTNLSSLLRRSQYQERLQTSTVYNPHRQNEIQHQAPADDANQLQPILQDAAVAIPQVNVYATQPSVLAYNVFPPILSLIRSVLRHPAPTQRHDDTQQQAPADNANQLQPDLQDAVVAMPPVNLYAAVPSVVLPSLPLPAHTSAPPATVPHPPSHHHHPHAYSAGYPRSLPLSVLPPFSHPPTSAASSLPPLPATASYRIPTAAAAAAAHDGAGYPRSLPLSVLPPFSHPPTSAASSLPPLPATASYRIPAAAAAAAHDDDDRPIVNSSLQQHFLGIRFRGSRVVDFQHLQVEVRHPLMDQLLSLWTFACNVGAYDNVAMESVVNECLGVRPRREQLHYYHDLAIDGRDEQLYGDVLLQLLLIAARRGAFNVLMLMLCVLHYFANVLD